MLALLLAGLLGQSVSQPNSQTVVSLGLETSAALNLYVDSTGSNSNACTSTGTAACLTIAGAMGKIPKRVKHAVVVTVAAGNFTGAVVDGFTVESTGSLTIQGTMGTSTIASGLATGTTASATAGSSFTATHGTATVTGAGWTVDDLRGKWYAVTGGTGSGQARAIQTNTATVVTIAGGWDTTPDATSTFAIQEPTSVINAAVTVTHWETPPATTSTYGFFVHSCAGGSERATISVGARLVVQQFKFTTTSRNIEGGDSNVVARRNWHSATAIGAEATGQSSLYLLDSVFTGATTAAFSIQNNAYAGVARNVFSGQSIVAQLSTATTVTMNGNYFYNASTAFIRILATQAISVVSTGDVADCNSTGSSFIAALGHGGASVALTSDSISNCPSGVLLDRGVAALLTVSGSGNTIAVEADYGAKVSVSANCTITGGTELSVDGTGYTLAAMRAATPKAEPTAANVYGSVIFE